MEGILQDDNGDILIQNGDFVIGDVNQDIVSDTIVAMPGDYKKSPLFGSGLRTAINGAPDVFFPGKLNSQLNAQGIEVNKITIDSQEGTIQVEV